VIGNLGFFFFFPQHRHAATQAYYSTEPVYVGNFDTCLLNNWLILRFSVWQMECSWRFHSFLHKIIVFGKKKLIFNISENNIISVKASKVLWYLCIHFWLSNLDPNLEFVKISHNLWIWLQMFCRKESQLQSQFCLNYTIMLVLSIWKSIKQLRSCLSVQEINFLKKNKWIWYINNSIKIYSVHVDLNCKWWTRCCLYLCFLPKWDYLLSW
jgi:hypothetical protein